MARLHSSAAMQTEARRRLPRFVMDFVEGGAGSESTVARNRQALDGVRLLPRVLTGCVTREFGAWLFGRRYCAPFGVAPLGLAGLVAPGADLGLARAATAAGIPFVLSTAATTAVEAIVAAAPDCWFQLYVGRDPPITDDLLRRARALELSVLVVTVDVPAPGRRLRDLANGFQLPLRPTPRLAADLLRHPRWLAAQLRGGAPRFANLERYANGSATARSLAELMAAQSSARLDWDLLRQIRAAWPSRLVVKGVLHPRDAARLTTIGVDGLIVSNHGGRQFDAAPAPIEVLGRIRDAVGPRLPLIVDGGIRSGEDIARVVGLGADFVLIGRPFLYAVAARGAERGPPEFIELLCRELDGVMAQLGCATLADLRERSTTP